MLSRVKRPARFFNEPRNYRYLVNPNICFSHILLSNSSFFKKHFREFVPKYVIPNPGHCLFFHVTQKENFFTAGFPCSDHNGQKSTMQVVNFNSF